MAGELSAPVIVFFQYQAAEFAAATDTCHSALDHLIFGAVFVGMAAPVGEVSDYLLQLDLFVALRNRTSGRPRAGLAARAQMPPDSAATGWSRPALP